MDLLEALGLSRPVADSAVCFELYQDEAAGQQQPPPDGAAAALEGLRVRCMQLLQPHVAGYVWQHEPLRLRSSATTQQPWVLKALQGRKQQQSPQQQQQQSPPCLWGVLRYEDNVEDEWFVVWLLLQLTAQLPGVSARCWDDDGEFLLIEAAYALPRWLKPETATNRVWLRQGQLHIVPPPSAKAPSLPPSPSTAQALAILRSGTVSTRRKTVEGAILERVSGYPGRAAQQVQRVLAWVPRRMGLLLQAEPQLVSGAVAAFMSRQRDEVQAAAKFRVLPPADMMTALVSLNRCMYAQLTQADFTAPRGYPAAPDGSWLGGSSERQLKAVSLGAKLTTGMEILAARLGLQAGSAAAADGDAGGAGASSSAAPAAGNEEQQTGASLAANPAWQSYLSVLHASGYFDGELQGSARHRQLLAAAQEAFVRSEAFARSTAALAAPKQRLQALLAAVDDAGAQASQQSPLAAVLDVAGLTAQEDGDEWMAAEAEQLQQQLEQAEWLAASQAARKQQRQQDKQQGGAPAGGVAGSAASRAAKPAEGPEVDAEQLLSGLKGFVQHLAGPEGAEVPAAARPGAAAGASNGSRSQAAAATAAAATTTAAASSAADRELDLDGDAVLHELMGFLDAAYGGELGDGQPDRAGDFLAKVQALQHHMEQAMQGGDGGDSGGMAGLLSKLADLPSDDYGSSDESSGNEGDSFYGADSDSEDAAAADAAADALLALHQEQAVGEPVLLPVPPPVSQRPARGSGGSTRPQQQQQQSNQPAAASALQGQRGWQQKLHDWDVITAPDSDDDEAEEDGLSLGSNSSDGGSSDNGGDDVGASSAAAGGKAGRAAAGGGAFHDSYSAAMEAELAATTMARTFERVQLLQAGGSDAAAAAAAAGGGDEDAAAALTPLDMDHNLIKSMVASYSAQGGMPGPASNLAGLLGLALPTEMEVEEEQGAGEAQQRAE